MPSDAKHSPYGFCAGHGDQYLRPSAIAWHLASDKNSLHDIGVGTRRYFVLPSTVAQLLAGDQEIPARLLRGARRLIPSAVAVARRLARKDKFMHDICVGRGSQHLQPLPSPGISPAMMNSPRNFCAMRSVT